MSYLTAKNYNSVVLEDENPLHILGVLFTVYQIVCLLGSTFISLSVTIWLYFALTFCNEVSYFLSQTRNLTENKFFKSTGESNRPKLRSQMGQRFLRGRPLDIQGGGQEDLAPRNYLFHVKATRKYFFHIHATPKYSFQHFL